MADAAQIRKVCAIIRADEARKIIVVSAAGKRSKDDHKITDLLYLCYAHIKYGVSCMDVFEQVKQRYLDIRDELGLDTPLEVEFDALWERMQHGIGEDELVSRGEYFPQGCWRTRWAMTLLTQSCGSHSRWTAA